jgi:hypothetical protein
VDDDKPRMVPVGKFIVGTLLHAGIIKPKDAARTPTITFAPRESSAQTVASPVVPVAPLTKMVFGIPILLVRATGSTRCAGASLGQGPPSGGIGKRPFSARGVAVVTA